MHITDAQHRNIETCYFIDPEDGRLALVSCPGETRLFQPTVVFISAIFYDVTIICVQ